MNITRRKKEVFHSQFMMMRGMIAFCHSDGVMHPEEIGYMFAMMNRVDLTDEQRARLEADFDEPQDIFEMLREINDPAFRSQLACFARILAFKDGVLDESEKSLLNKLEATLRNDIDMDAIKAQVDTFVSAELKQHDLRIDKHRPQRGKHGIPWIYLLDRFLLTIGIDLMKE
jgi:uncharacterized membrane protein YebE (DUF533 family)